MQWKQVILGLYLILCVVSAAAHSGRTDKDGCHVDRKTGIRHCH